MTSATETEVPVFGKAGASVEYARRRTAYVVVCRPSEFAAVAAHASFFLPGGGCEGSESAEATVRREVVEEIGFELEEMQSLGSAVQYFFAASEGVHFQVEASFFLAKLSVAAVGMPEHSLVWLPAVDAEELLFHESHAWAVHKAFERNNVP